MALQDLTPQLRTRLSRVERAVGWFVLLALGLLLFGFGYYLYNTAQRKGWFLEKIAYETCVTTGAGLKIGDPVKLMGFDVGEITAIIPNDPSAYYNITIQFRVRVDRYHYQGYIWSDSKVKVTAGDLLGNRYLEIVKGVAGVPTVRMSTNQTPWGILRDDLIYAEQKRQLDELRRMDAVEAEAEGRPPRSESHLRMQVQAELNHQAASQPDVFYTPEFDRNIFFLDPVESPAVTERLEQLVTQMEQALPAILAFTNQVAAVLGNSATLTSNLNQLALTTRPAAANLADLSRELRVPGAFGEWLWSTNLTPQLELTLTSAHTNVAALADSFSRSLDNLAGITSNLHAQVQSNTNVLSEISAAVVQADELMQGLKRHWLLRSAFRERRTNAPAPRLHSPRGAQTFP